MAGIFKSNHALVQLLVPALVTPTTRRISLSRATSGLRRVCVRVPACGNVCVCACCLRALVSGLKLCCDVSAPLCVFITSLCVYNLSMRIYQYVSYADDTFRWHSNHHSVYIPMLMLMLMLTLMLMLMFNLVGGTSPDV